ncbi:hypothetical protein EDC96DRAFT_545520 [Choanephora cucurbitarum]|nr:hypothetical protein EDC96DRAFT_545520 [Choanephora cucurbitarum]
MHEIQRQYSKQQAVIRNTFFAGKESDDGRFRAERCRQLVVCTECPLHISSVVWTHHWQKYHACHVVDGVKVYMYGRVLLIDILNYTIDQLIQTTLDASELCTIATSCLRLTSTDCRSMLQN